MRSRQSLVTAAQILAVLLANDGTGSGWDADLLDGQHGSYYRDATNINAGTLATARGGTGVSNASGSLTFNGATVITGGGTVALAGYTLTVPATGTAALLGADNAFTGANTFTNASGVLTRQGSGQDGVILLGRAGGASSYSNTLTTATLAGNVTCTLPATTTTLAGYAVAGTFTAAQIMSSTLTLDTSSNGLTISKTSGSTLTVSSTAESHTSGSCAVSVAGAVAAASLVVPNGSTSLIINDRSGVGNQWMIRASSASSILAVNYCVDGATTGKLSQFSVFDRDPDATSNNCYGRFQMDASGNLRIDNNVAGAATLGSIYFGLNGNDAWRLYFSGGSILQGGSNASINLTNTSGQILTLASTTDASSSTAASAALAGGFAVAKGQYIGTFLNVGTTLTVGSTSNTAALTLSGGILQTQTITDPGSTTYANGTTLTYALTANNGQVVGHRTIIQTSNNAFNYTASIGVRGHYSAVTHAGTGTVTGMTAGISEWNVTNTGNVTNAWGHRFTSSVSAAATITTGRGAYIGAPTISGGGAITTFNALEIEALTGAGTNRAIYTQGAGLVVISDTSANAVQVSGGIVSIGATQGIGYATGAGGAQTQSTSKSTGVTLNKVCGTITMDAASLAAATSVSFTLTNSAIAATDVVKVVIKSGATADSYTVDVTAVAAGSCRIQLRNFTGGALAEAVVLSFAVIKAVAA